MSSLIDRLHCFFPCHRLAAAALVGPVIAVLVVSAGTVACTPRANVPATLDQSPAQDKQPASAKAEAPKKEHADTGQGDPARETWDVVYMNGAKVGHSHTTITTITESGRNLVRHVNETETTIKRFGQTITIHVALTSVETPSGQLVRFHTEQTAGPAVITTTGHYANDQLSLETSSVGKTVPSAIPWDPTWGGFFAAERSLRETPMKPGEIRSLRSLLPIFNQVGDIRMTATGYESTRMLDGMQELLSIAGTVEIAGNTIEQTMWTDRSGDVLKTEIGAMQQVTYRTTKEVALGETGDFDVGQQSLVQVTRRLRDPHNTERIRYRAHVRDGDLEGVFATGPNQSVKSIDKQTAELTVIRIRPDNPETVADPDKPSAADLAANNIIQSDDPRIVEMAATAAGDAKDPWVVAQNLERHVKQVITEKNFSQALATAAEVVESREGDCTEHAVLLVALCRARQIPARVAIGLVYLSAATGPGFAYHMWSEVWINDRWIPLDATLGKGGIGAAHLKIADSNLEGANAYTAFLPVIKVIQRLELEIVAVQP